MNAPLDSYASGQLYAYPFMTGAQLPVAFFLQMFFILAVCRIVGAAGRRVGQPQVVGEMVAGVLMGPSLFGLFFPELQHHLFPKDSLKTLYVGAQLGVGLYMFLVGVENRTGPPWPWAR